MTVVTSIEPVSATPVVPSLLHPASDAADRRTTETTTQVRAAPSPDKPSIPRLQLVASSTRAFVTNGSMTPPRFLEGARDRYLGSHRNGSNQLTFSPAMTDRKPSQASITALLQAVGKGDREALDALFPLVYEELRSLARSQRRRWHGNLTLTATALVHEAYVKLADQGGFVPENRGHFFAVAAKAMRHILCNYARDRGRLKRGGGAEHVPIDQAMDAVPIGVSEEQAAELSALDEVLRQLEQIDPRQGRIVECRFFAGLSIEDTALALGISPATVKREWTMARAWLYREMQKRPSTG